MLLIFIAGLLWGTIGIFVNELNSLGASSALTCFLRMLFAFLIMFTFAFIKHGKNFFRIDKKTLLLCAGLGLISQGFFNICYTASIKLNGMGAACVLMYSAPVFTAIASGIFFHEKISRLKIFSLALNILGCILTVTGGNIFNNSFSLTGILAGIGTGFCYGMAAIFGKAAGEKADSLIMSAYSYFFAALFLFIFNRPELNSSFNIKILSTAFLFGLIPTSFAYMIYYDGIKKIKDTSRVPVIASIEPIAAVIIGMLLYNEQAGAVNFIGVAVVIFSIFMMIEAE